MYVYIASFPGSPSFRAIIPCMTFDPPEGKVIRGIIARKEGEPGNEAAYTHAYNMNSKRAGNLKGVENGLPSLMRLNIPKEWWGMRAISFSNM